MNPGQYTDLPIEEYVRDPCKTPSLSSGIINTLLSKSPLHAWHAHPRLNPAWRTDEATNFDIGTAAHALLLEGAESRLAVIDAEDWRTKAAKEERTLARLSGKVPILAKHHRAVREMAEVAKAFMPSSEAGNMFADGKPEQTFIWQYQGATCRCRPDWITYDHRILSYKTTADANPATWIRRTALSNGYEIQALWEAIGYAEILQKPSSYIWLVQETEPPYTCILVGVTPALVQSAEAKINYAIAKWNQCLASDQWPGYSSRIHFAEPNPWDEAQWQEKMSMEAMEKELR